MKTKSYFLILVFGLSNLAYSQQFIPQFTGLNPVGSTSPFHMVTVDENTVWASSSSQSVGKFNDVPNVIIHTTDCGITWKIDTLPVDSPNNFYIACISAIGQDSAWVSCTDGDISTWVFKIYATFDGGQNWQIQNVPFSDNEAYGGQIHFFDHLEGIIFAGNTDGYFQVFKTYDSGNTWQRLPEANFPSTEGNDEADVDNGYYAIQDTIWVGTTKGRILKSIDRGTTWQVYGTPVSSSSDGVIFEVSFSNSKYGIARYTDNFDFYEKKLMVTTDGGVNWSIISPQGLDKKVFDINSVPNKPGEYLGTSYFSSAVTSNKLYYSKDNGANWSKLGQANVPGRISLFDSEIGWISEIDATSPGIDVYKMQGVISKIEEVAIEGLLINPNPFKQELVIKNDYNYNLESIDIFDFLGKKVYSQTITTNTNIFLENLGFLLPGIYFLKINSKEGVVTKKIIKG